MVNFYTYDPVQAYRLTDIDTVKDTTVLQDIHYTYDDNGNILTLTDNSSTNLAKSVIYDYDDLNRLTSATVNYINPAMTDYSRQYSYDSIGNMTSNSALGTMNYANNQPHQLSSYPGKTLSYDLAGNVLNNSSNEFTWDWRSRMTYSRVLNQPEKTYYEYDHNNQRYLKYSTHKVFHPYPCEYEPEGLGMPLGSPIFEEGGGEMQLDSGCGGYYSYDIFEEDKYIDKYFEKDIANSTKSHVYLGSMKLATVNNSSSPYYILSDHLSSSTILLDSSGTLIETSDYEPYGQESYNQTISNVGDNYKFTGQEYDDENGLQYFGARYMDNNVAKFYSIDPYSLQAEQLVKFINDPQLLNSYSYSKNNPVVFTDPDGKFPFLVILGIVAVGVLLDNIHAAQAPTSAENVNYTSKVKEFADLSVPGYEGLPPGVKFTAGLALGGLTSKAERATGKIFVKSIDRWLAQDAVSMAERKSVQALWSNSTFKTTEDAILYHYDKHVVQEGIEKSVYDYSSDARKFWNANSKWIGNSESPVRIDAIPQLSNGSAGYKIKDYSSGWGGIYTKEGDIVSFFYN